MNRAPSSTRNGSCVLPNAMAVGSVKASQLTVAIDAVDVAVLEHGRADDGVQRFGVLLVAAGDLPELFDVGLVFEQPQQQSAVVERGEEHSIAVDDGCGDADRHFYGLPGIAPEHFSRGRGEAGDAIAGPAHDHRLPALLHDDWGSVLSAIAQRPPDFVARVFVQCDHASSLTADVKDYQVVVNQRRSGDAPIWHFDVVKLVEVFVPENPAASSVKDVEAASSAERVRFAVVNPDASARSSGVVIADSAIGAGIFVGPKRFTRVLVKTKYSLELGRFGNAVSEVHAAVGDSWPAVTGAGFDAPFGR